MQLSVSNLGEHQALASPASDHAHTDIFPTIDHRHPHRDASARHAFCVSICCSWDMQRECQAFDIANGVTLQTLPSLTQPPVVHHHDCISASPCLALHVGAEALPLSL